MTPVTASVAEEPVQAETVRPPDRSGRDQMTKNVLASWAGQVVFIVAGFLMPRLIDAHLGQATLGIWDFAWSTAMYFGLAEVGVGSSVNRYVAMYRTTGERDRLCSIVSSVHVIQYGACLVALVGSVLLAWAVPLLIVDPPLDPTWIRLTVGLLGAAIGADMFFNVYGGVLTGCHRWDLHNAVNAGSYAAIVTAMVLALSLGGGLPWLAAAHLVGIVAQGLTRRHLALRVCPELRVSLSLANRKDASMAFVFGGKSIVDNLARLLVAQANSLLVAMHLGPAALAVYARPTALVRVADTMLNKVGHVLTPATSAMLGSGQAAELRAMFIATSRLTAFLAMPIVIFLTVLGGAILQVWMGPSYHDGLLMGIIACGNFLVLTQRPAAHILVGMNKHGRVGWASLAVACCGVAMATIALGPLQGGLVSAALSLVVPYSLGNGLFIMIYACRQVGVPLKEYLRRVFAAPAACAIPFVLTLGAVRVAWADQPLIALGAGVVVSGTLLVPLYWRFAIPAGLRRDLLARLPTSVARVLDRQAPPNQAAGSRVHAVVDVGPTDSETSRQHATPAEMRAFPYPFKAALAICSDLDLTPDRHAYLDTARYLNTTDPTSMGPGVGLEVGNTIYFDMDRSQFAYWNTDDAGRDMVRALIRSGHIDCLHSFGDLATSRMHAARSLDDLARHDCRLEVWIDHAVAPTNFGGDIMRGFGDVPGSPVYHADLTCDAGVRYVWRGRVTSIIGQDAPRSLTGLWRTGHARASSTTVIKEAVKGGLARIGHGKYHIHGANRLMKEAELRDGRTVYEFLRANPHFGGVSRGDTAVGLAEVLTEGMLRQLVARGGMSILYTHLGKTRSAREPFDESAREALRGLARMRDGGDILVTTTRRLLGYAAARRRLTGVLTTQDGCTFVHLTVAPDPVRPLAREDLDGTTVYVPDSNRARLWLNGREIHDLRRHGADHSGRQSLMLPWIPREFPSL
jgi:O-antigen/teichoic acid export membrane protein